jgi:hypothetical protein
VQVVLHFHGWGFRKGDPYAGYLVAAKGSSSPAGTVRDIDQEHWEQQISSLKDEGAQIVAILAQGRGPSDFGRFPTFGYVRDVLEKSGRPELVKLADAENYSIVLSAHSGGGSTKVVPSLDNAEAETTDRAGLKAQAPTKADGRVINKLQPVDLVVLYEALNGDGDVLEVVRWVGRQLDRIVPQLERSPDQALAATPTLRGYYGKRDSGYRERHRWLACLIDDAIESRVPRAVSPGGGRSLSHHRGGRAQGRERRARAGHERGGRGELGLGGRRPARGTQPADRSRSGGLAHRRGMHQTQSASQSASQSAGRSARGGGEGRQGEAAEVTAGRYESCSERAHARPAPAARSATGLVQA